MTSNINTDAQQLKNSVLLVTDLPGKRTQMTAQLEARGYNVIQASLTESQSSAAAPLVERVLRTSAVSNIPLRAILLVDSTNNRHQKTPEKAPLYSNSPHQLLGESETEFNDRQNSLMQDELRRQAEGETFGVRFVNGLRATPSPYRDTLVVADEVDPAKASQYQGKSNLLVRPANFTADIGSVDILDRALNDHEDPFLRREGKLTTGNPALLHIVEVDGTRRLPR